MWRVVAIAIVSLVAAAARAQSCNDDPPSARPEVRLEPDRHTVDTQFRAVVASPIRAVARELLEPARLPAWVPGLTDARPLDHGFAAEWHLPWPLGRVFEVVREEHHFDGTDLLLTWTLVHGDIARHEVCWRLRPIAPELTEVIYAGAVRFRRWVPLFLVRAAERRALPEAIRRLQLRVRDPQSMEVRRARSA